MMGSDTSGADRSVSIKDVDWVPARPTPLFEFIRDMAVTSNGKACAEFAGEMPILSVCTSL